MVMSNLTDLNEYIQSQIDSGKDIEKVLDDLRAGGWSDAQIEASMKATSQQPEGTRPQVNDPQQQAPIATPTSSNLSPPSSTIPLTVGAVAIIILLTLAYYVLLGI